MPDLLKLVMALLAVIYLVFALLGGLAILSMRRDKKEKMSSMDFVTLIFLEILYQFLWAALIMVIYQVASFAISGGTGASQDIWFLPSDLISWFFYDVLGIKRHTPAPKPGGMLLPVIQFVQLARFDPTLALRLLVG